MNKKERAAKINTILTEMYPDVACTLNFMTPLQLLLATQLAAQSTDVQVNVVTEKLFQKYKTVEDYAGADILELEKDIHATGFYHNKAKNLKACCIKLLTDYNGEVPNTMEALITLPGVGRKTANVVLGEIFHVPGFIVDTHAGRLSRRMGFTRQEDPAAVELEMMKVLPKKDWTMFSHRLVAHGRAVCKARKPGCESCLVRPYCVFGQNEEVPTCRKKSK